MRHPVLYRIAEDGSRSVLTFRGKRRKPKGVTLPSGRVLCPHPSTRMPDEIRVKLLGPRQTGRKGDLGDYRTGLVEKGHSCWFCGRPPPLTGPDYATIEHLVPLSKGGDNHRSNLLLAHLSCNNRAGTMLLCEKWKLRRELRKNVQ